MSRLSFRPRPLDIHKKLPIVKSIKDFEDDEPTTTSTRNSQLQRLAAEAENEVYHAPSKKPAAEIPTPQFVIVDTYESDYLCTFSQPSSYVRGRGARSELGDFVEYDLDNEDEDWLQEFNNERKILTPEKLEMLLFKLEVLDLKARERAGIVMATIGSPLPALLQLDIAYEALQHLSVRHTVLQSVYSYWKEKRGRWQKPILRRLQPPPPVNDTNPYNVFRPREKAHRLHTRRMQRRENSVQSFEKLRQVRRNLDHAKTIMEALIKREEKKREAMESEINLQRIRIKYKHETQFAEDGLSFPGFPPFSVRYGTFEDDIDSDDMGRSRRHSLAASAHKLPLSDSRLMMLSQSKRELQWTRSHPRWLHRLDPHEPVLLFTKPVDPRRLAAAGIMQPPDPPLDNGTTLPPYRYCGRIGRGGRIIFDRQNPLLHTPISHESKQQLTENRRPPTHG